MPHSGQSSTQAAAPTLAQKQAQFEQALGNQHSLVSEIDAELYKLVRGIDILSAVTPLNFQQEKSTFISKHYSRNPEFVYDNHRIDSFQKKRQLFNLPVEKIRNDDLQKLYLDVIDSYIDKIDQYKSIGSAEFLYDSLRYYGEPSSKDIRNAAFILHLPEQNSVEEQSFLNAKSIQTMLVDFAKTEGYSHQIVLDDALVANALVSGTKVKINPRAKVAVDEAMALAHHELGVHLLTTLNGRDQPLKILSLGSPVNTCTQEGLAILAEYLAGVMTLNRLKILALRVMAVDSMIQEKSFRHTFLMLKEQHHVDDEMAFTICTRVYRGGGLTKDYLYLQGFHQMLNTYENEAAFLNLLTGKTSLAHLPLITRLIEQGILYPPKRITPAFRSPVDTSDIDTFIAHALK